jgi:3-dehydroquinate dehydratase/shikimate dehydrogenase
MICIAIAQESRRLALADMLNASRQCDLVELRLDRFAKAPDVSELLTARTRPIILSCRRQEDGGHWEGAEEERLALLRQCIISKADYVEIELDAADQIRPFPPAKRVITYTNLNETPADIADIYARAQTKKPDVIKLVTRAQTPEEAWPLVQILAKPAVPTVVVGLGKSGVMLSILGKKIGAPWTYAALERGMEAYPDQPTVHDLEKVYHYRAIERTTRFIGVSGFTPREYATVAALNAAFAHLNLPARCLPLGVGNMRLFRKIVEAVKLAGVVVDEEHQEAILEIAGEVKEVAEQVRAADLILHKNEAWHAYNLRLPAIVAALENALKGHGDSDKPLQGRMVLLSGIQPVTRPLARMIQDRGGAIIVASQDRNAAHDLAQELGCRFIQRDALYTTMHDVLILCSEEKGSKPRSSETGIHQGHFKPGLTVIDLTAPLNKSAMLREAEARGSTVVAPRGLLLDQLALLARRITSQDLPREVLEQALRETLEEDV